MSEDKKELQKRLKPLYEEILEIKEPSGLEVYPIFQILPPRKDYPDYYKLAYQASDVPQHRKEAAKSPLQ